MIKIELNIHYPNLTIAEQIRIGDIIRQAVHHTAVSAACLQTREGGVGLSSNFIRSQHLNVETLLTQPDLSI